MATEETLQVEVAVIGAGTAGLAAYRAARAQVPASEKVVIIESGPYGTTCARVGCMPSKLLIAAAEAAHHARHAAPFGVIVPEVKIDGKSVLERVRRERDRFVGFVVAGVNAIEDAAKLRGHARFVGRDANGVTLDVDGRRIEARAVVIATGSSPVVPPMFTDLGDRLVVNDDVFEWPTLPRAVAVFGAGVIGLELGQALSRLGVRVRIFGRGGAFGPLSDPELRDVAKTSIGAELDVDTEAKVHKAERQGDFVVLEFEERGEIIREPFDYILAAAGRKPNLKNLGLEALGLELDAKGVPVFDRTTMQCGDAPVFLAGDVDDDVPLLHEASDEGKIAGDNAGRFPQVSPGVRRTRLAITFSDPNIAVTGATYKELQDKKIEYVCGEVSFEDQGRSRVIRQNKGKLHVYADATSGELLGAEMIGPRMEHVAHLLAWCREQRLTIARMLEMPFYHPVIEEGLRTALRDAQAKLDAHAHTRSTLLRSDQVG